MPAALALAAVLCGLPAEAGWPSGCERTARLMREACAYEFRDDLLVANAVCTNLDDFGEAIECRIEAFAEMREARQLCGEQRDARVDLCDALGEDRYDPDLDPALFVSAAEAAANPNPYFPLVPGNVAVLEKEEERITIEVLDETVEILGIECAVVRDVEEEDGEIVEDTFDWFAQDVFGNVWYMGELSREFEDGELVGIEGSWEAGEDGAKPGIVMFADPVPGTVYRQEWLLGEAEDAGEVIAVGVSESVPAVSCDDCVQIRDFTPLEPDANEYKFFAPGIGLILEIDIESGERTELVEFTPGG